MYVANAIGNVDCAKSSIDPSGGLDCTIRPAR